MTIGAESAASKRPVPRRWPEVTLDEKYTKGEGRILINGTQALVRTLLLQRELDQRAGLNTAGFVSGYRGSPLGTFDMAMWRAKEHLERAQVTFQPGVNEELAATAIWGTQQLDNLPGARVDGVYGMWYGKGPGVDRCGDVFKHANHQGAHPRGGVLVVCGDDHPGKSSTVAHQSEQALSASLIPCLYPASVQEFIEFGLKGWALSRYSGLWVGFKVVNETIEQTCTVDLARPSICLPDKGELAEAATSAMGYVPPIQREIAVRRKRLPLVHRFVRANGLDRKILGDDNAPLGIVATGKAYQDVLQAFQLLGMDTGRAERLGIAVYKVGCIWPLEPTGISEFASGRKELLFVEEKAAFVELQAAEILYNAPVRPVITGKRDPEGRALLPAEVPLEPGIVARAIVARLEALGRADDELRTFLANIDQGVAPASGPPQATRIPYFCSGCPHNTSTKLPEGSFGMAGIGCHGMAVFARQDTMFPGQMGGEGANWIGLSRYTKTPHVFQNLGDGTYYHSGHLAIRAAVAAGINITYKILYNEAVAMTGGQPVDGPISVAEISHQVVHEGVKKCVVVTDNPAAYDSAAGLAAGVEVRHRDDLESIQREFREIPGCTVIIYVQTCAAEKRRLRKRRRMVDPSKRLFINDAVCEGCGDCSVQSTCVSIQPLPTEFGLKRRIDQSSCNKDYSCAKGFCPSFVTVLGGRPSRPGSDAITGPLAADLPSPPAEPSGEIERRGYNVMIAGVGGTGVITVGAVLAMAAHLEGKACSVYDMTGLSQKNGAVYGHLRIARMPSALAAQRLGIGDADLVLGFDLVAALSGDALPTYRKGRTRVVGDARVTPTAAFQFNPDGKADGRILQSRLGVLAGEERCEFIDATGMAVALCGDTIAANFFVVGFALQKGLLPLGAEAIEKALELNGVAVDLNRRALRLGRLWAHDADRIRGVLSDSAAGLLADLPADQELNTLVATRKAFLTAYQDKDYARRYEALVERVRAAEQAMGGGSDELAKAVARYYAKLLAYKDEYEVGRLYADPAFLQKLEQQFEPGYKLRFNLAPPILGQRDPVTGHLRKREFGAWVLPVFRVLAKLRILRGTRLDIFGYFPERRRERKLIAEYEELVARILSELGSSNYAIAVELASIPEKIRGFGHVKERALVQAREQQERLMRRFEDASAKGLAASVA